MEGFLQQDLGSTLLSIFILLGWLGIGLVFLRIVALSLKKILELIFKEKK